MTVAAPLRRASDVVLGAYVPVRTATWPERSRLFVVGDRIGWSIDDDAERLRARAARLGYEVAPPGWARFARGQAVFHPDHFAALTPRWLHSSHALGLSYYHGRPGTDGHPEFDRAYEALRTNHERIDRIQVTHAEMHDLVLAAGVDAAKVFRIPIGVDLEHFSLPDERVRGDARSELGLPPGVFVVGSFQKDGVGMGAGHEPKLVKGPDTLVATLARVHADLPEVLVLLTGHARGYVRSELERLGIPHRHVLLGSRQELARAYAALDCYLVTSRQDGGPKGVLEAMASGVPVVSTRVGQAQELVRDGTDALLADVDDVDSLSAAVVRLHGDSQLSARLREDGRRTAEGYADERLDGAWAALLDDFARKGAHGAD